MKFERLKKEIKKYKLVTIEDNDTIYGSILVRKNVNVQVYVDKFVSDNPDLDKESPEFRLGLYEWLEEKILFIHIKVDDIINIRDIGDNKDE